METPSLAQLMKEVDSDMLHNEKVFFAELTVTLLCAVRYGIPKERIVTILKVLAETADSTLQEV